MAGIYSQEILHKVNQNDPSLTELNLVDNDNNYGFANRNFYSDNSDDYSTLGAAIANNIHLKRLEVRLSNSSLPLGRGFYDALKCNSSISDLLLHCDNRNIAGGVAHEILQVYQENNSHLTFLGIYFANLQSGGDRVIVDTLRCCRNLQSLDLTGCNIRDAQLLPIVDALRGHRILEELHLVANDIGNAGCDAIATLLIDPNCNLRTLYLGGNAIDSEGATAIANSLTNNKQLQKLYLKNNPIDRSVQDVFSNILCNTSNINNTYSSNHTLESLLLPQDRGQNLQSLLSLNRIGKNKSHVAMRKILQYHPNIDMEPMFEWDMEEGEERNLKALPYVLAWFEKAKVAVEDVEHECDCIEDRMLSAIVQFAKAMPLLFVPTSHIKVELFEGVVNVRVDADKKRKRLDGR